MMTVQKQRDTMKRAIWKALPYMGLVVVIGGLCAVLEGLLSIYTMKAVDAVYQQQLGAFQGELRHLILTAVALIPVTILLALVRGLYKRRAIVSAKVSYIRRLFGKHINEFQNENNAKYVSVVTNDLNTLEGSYIDASYEVVISGINFAVAVAVIGTVSPVALGVSLVVGAVSTLLSTWISKPLSRHQKHRSELYGGYTAYIKEVLSAFHIIKSNDLTDKVREDYHKKSEDIQQKGYVIDKIFTYISALNRLNFTLAFYAILAVTAYMGIQGSLTIGGVILVITNMEKIMQPLTQISDFLPKIFSTKELFARIEATLANRDNHEETIEITGFNDSLRLEQVSFRFEDNPVLASVNLTLKKGGKYLLIGPSGGGKSTLLRLLRKYHSPESGRILIDGQDLRDVKKDSYFKHIANVEQQVFLFEDSIKNNLTLYKDYPEDRLERAIEGAGLTQFINQLPEGLDTMLYDNGKNISGGERSRMAIARALLQEAELIFLDEAFSSLDAATASAIERTLLSLEDLTVVNVSHVVFEESRNRYTQVLTVKNRGLYFSRSA